MILSKLDPIAFKIGNIEIYWYALFILSGAIIAYLTIREIVGKKGYKKEMIDTLFVTCFPAGIIGARIWWCIADAGSPWHNGNFWGFITQFRDGGLAIQGGVIAGIGLGIIILRTRYKDVPLHFVVDTAVPNILIAQALGRWGNFFNQEVYGACVDASALSWLPKFIQNQMAGGGSIACEIGQAAQPLFLYESLANIVGWVLIVFIIRIFCKKRKPGDLAALYFVWYGTVRVIMEPLRNEQFIMNSPGTTSKLTLSVIVSILFIVLGVAYLIFIRIYMARKNKKKIEEAK